MYAKKILIFNKVDNKYALPDKQLCGMVKLINNGNSVTQGTLVVTNVDKQAFGEWWLVVSFDKRIFTFAVDNLDRYEFEINSYLCESVGCVLAKRENGYRVVASADVGSQQLSTTLSFNIKQILDNASLNGGKYIDELDKATAYEKFVASTDNYYDATVATANAVDVDRLKEVVKQRYKTVTEYSDAFERYYATGRGDNYYQTVKKEIARLLIEFPPYYPLMEKFKDSFFVRIEFPDTKRFFVMGVLQQDGQVKYICYGLPGEKDNFCDKDFVYVDGNPEGFWMLYQDALTGQITVWRDK